MRAHDHPPYTIGKHRGKFALVFYEGGKRHRCSLGCSDASEARRLAPSVWEQLSRPKGRTVADLWEAYCKAKSGHAVVGTMEFTWRALKDLFGPLSPADITSSHCDAHIANRRSSKISNGTLHTELGHLRMVMNWAAKQRLIETAPHIPRPRKPPPRDRHLTREEVQRLAAACSMPHLCLFVHVAFGTAGRNTAILGLTWNRVDFERGKIDLRDPTMTSPHKGRAIVPMPQSLKVRLLEAQRGAQTEYVIEWAGKPVASVKKGLARAAARAGLPHVSPHDLRHSAAVRQAEEGVPFEEIASHLGHRDVDTTRRIYARFGPDALKRSAAALELDEHSVTIIRREA